MKNAIKILESFNYEDGILADMCYNIGDILVVPVWTEEFCDLVISAADELEYKPLDSDMGEYGAAPG